MEYEPDKRQRNLNRCKMHNCEELSIRGKCKVIIIGDKKMHPKAMNVCECPLEIGSKWWKIFKDDGEDK